MSHTSNLIWISSAALANQPSGVGVESSNGGDGGGISKISCHRLERTKSSTFASIGLVCMWQIPGMGCAPESRPGGPGVTHICKILQMSLHTATSQSLDECGGGGAGLRERLLFLGRPIRLNVKNGFSQIDN